MAWLSIGFWKPMGKISPDAGRLTKTRTLGSPSWSMENCQMAGYVLQTNQTIIISPFAETTGRTFRTLPRHGCERWCCRSYTANRLSASHGGQRLQKGFPDALSGPAPEPDIN